MRVLDDGRKVHGEVARELAGPAVVRHLKLGVPGRPAMTSAFYLAKQCTQQLLQLMEVVLQQLNATMKVRVGGITGAGGDGVATP